MKLKKYVYRCQSCGLKKGETPCEFSFRSSTNILDEPFACPFGNNVDGLHAEWYRVKKKRKPFKRYKVVCLQKTDFMSDTEDEPMTAMQLRKRFWDLGDCRTEKFVDFTLEYIADMWDVSFEEVT